jgi:prepilin-type N-terminal cleavage/methylation domain-containing protein
MMTSWIVNRDSWIAENRLRPRAPVFSRSTSHDPRITTRRNGFTLLEVILASAIALLLMWGLYVGMDVQLRQTDEGRTVVNQADLARNLLTRMSAEVSGCLTPITASKATLIGAVTGTNLDTTAGLTPTAFNMGLQGDASQVTVYISTVPKVNADAADRASAEQQQQSASDIRRVTYWLANGGLARQEVSRVTANDDDAALPPNVDESKFIYAEDVVGLSFQYFDGTNWTDTWDGSTLGADGKTPIGPPRLVQISLTIRYAGTQGGEAKEKTFIHSVAIGAANAQPTSAGATPAGTTSGGSSSSTTGGSP